MSTTTAPSRRIRVRLAAVIAAAALAGALSPIVGLQATSAQAAGDVCDLCSLGFDPVACERLGGWPYDSTLESPPPAVAGGAQPAPQPAAPQPAAPAPAPAAPAAPQPAAPQTSTKTTTTGTTESTAVTQGGTAVVATAPASPTFTHEVSGRTLALSWAAPADGGAAITGYKLVLNNGTPIEIAGDATAYEITLGAGTYDAVLIATNSVGDSAPSAAVSGIEVAGATATPKPTTKSVDASDAVSASDTQSASPAAGLAVIGTLVLAAGGLLTWWWLRRRNAPAAATADAGTPPAE